MGSDDRTTGGSATAPASSRLWPVILLFVTAIIYGLTFSLNRVAITAGIPFAAYVFWHALGGTILLFLFCLMRGDLPKLTRPHLKAYSSIAVVGWR